MKHLLKIILFSFLCLVSFGSDLFAAINFPEPKTKVECLSVLGLTGDPTSAQVSDAYKQLALRYHPDKVLDKSESEKKEAEGRFKQISVARNRFSQNNFECEPYVPQQPSFNPYARASANQQFYADMEEFLRQGRGYNGTSRTYTSETAAERAAREAREAREAAKQAKRKEMDNKDDERHRAIKKHVEDDVIVFKVGTPLGCVTLGMFIYFYKVKNKQLLEKIKKIKADTTLSYQEQKKEIAKVSKFFSKWKPTKAEFITACGMVFGWACFATWTKYTRDAYLKESRRLDDEYQKLYDEYLNLGSYW